MKKFIISVLIVDSLRQLMMSIEIFLHNCAQKVTINNYTSMLIKNLLIKTTVNLCVKLFHTDNRFESLDESHQDFKK